MSLMGGSTVQVLEETEVRKVILNSSLTLNPHYFSQGVWISNFISASEYAAEIIMGSTSPGDSLRKQMLSV